MKNKNKCISIPLAIISLLGLAWPASQIKPSANVQADSVTRYINGQRNIYRHLSARYRPIKSQHYLNDRVRTSGNYLYHQRRYRFIRWHHSHRGYIEIRGLSKHRVKMIPRRVKAVPRHYRIRRHVYRRAHGYRIRKNVRRHNRRYHFSQLQNPYPANSDLHNRWRYFRRLHVPYHVSSKSQNDNAVKSNPSPLANAHWQDYVFGCKTDGTPYQGDDHDVANIGNPINLLKETNRRTLYDANQDRITHGLSPFRKSRFLSKLAHLRSRQLVEDSYSHYDRNGNLYALNDFESMPHRPDFKYIAENINFIDIDRRYDSMHPANPLDTYADSTNDIFMNHEPAYTHDGHRKNLLRNTGNQPVYIGVASSFGIAFGYPAIFIVEDFAG